MGKRATKKQIIGSLCLLAVVAGIGFWWWPHLWWSFIIARNQVRIPAVPVTQLEASGKTAGWYDCRVGPLLLKLPPELAEGADRSTGKSTINFTTSNFELAIHIPHKVSPEQHAEFARVAAAYNQSVMGLIAESYTVSTDDFRWTMSRAELRKLQVLLSMGQNFPHFRAIAVETLFGPKLETMLIISNRRLASFEWQLRDGTAAGYVSFTQKEGDLDFDMVRDICRSVDCDETRLGPPPAKRDLQQILETVETTRPGSDKKSDRGE